jgi:predicted ATPase/class 3 adenylate cyclase
MLTCPACGREAPDDSAFCSKCGAALAAPAAHPEERKVVTTLFCDLVGSTALGEDADPEDVDALLRRYNALARQVVESHGGTVEKFIGDAVVAVFGVPATHEDDPERAVRAGLKLVQAVEELPPVAGHPIQVRVGVNTGEALVRLDVTPGSGEGFLTGDAVNVGARLEAAAPPMGVVGGATTHELTRKAIVYEALPPVAAKGKREPLEAWLAKEPLARTGARALEGATPFVGRAVELSYLTALLDKAADSSSPQIALVVGEPGIGKSRLVAELFAQVEASPRLVTWRQGRCLPYGEGVTFWALAEIVKGHAGILESDGRETVEAKLEQVLPAGEDRPWFRQRLRALLGLEAPKAEREENFTAWLRFLEEVAAQGPTVLILEDLHWADEALLDFLEFFALHVTHVPLMIVATARSELFERHPSFGGAVRINRIALEPLSQDEIEALIASVLDDLAVDLRTSIAKQAQGNPFYAEESARLVRDRAEDESGTSLLAGSVQAVIAARLDALAPELKALLSDAAVVGDVFWAGLLVAMSERGPDEVAQALDELTVKQLVYRVRSSSMAGEREYAFSHALAREVGYAQLPRLTRARKHAAVAGWIERKASDRAEDLAEILAHHYATAVDLARAAGETELADSVLESAIAFLTLAGKRVLGVDVGAAERYYSRALDLAGASADERPGLLCGWAKVLSLTKRSRESVAVWEKAIEGLRAAGERRRAAVEMCELAGALETLGEPTDELCRSALDLLAGDDPSPELVRVLEIDVAGSFVTEKLTAQEVIEAADRVVAISSQLGLPEPAIALAFRGQARMNLGDRGGIDDMDRAQAAAKAQGLADVLTGIQFNYAASIMDFRGARAALEAAMQGLDVAQRRGDQTMALAFRAGLIYAQYQTGDWDDALAGVEALETALRETEDHFSLFLMQIWWVAMLAARGEPEEANRHVGWLLEHGAASEAPWISAWALAAAIAVNSALAQSQIASGMLRDLRQYKVFDYVELFSTVIRAALNAGDSDLAAGLVQDLAPSSPMREHIQTTCQVLLDDASGEHATAATGFADAAARWHDFGVPYEEAQALLGQGRCLVALGRTLEATPVLEQARVIFARLKAKPALGETDALFATAGNGQAAR